MTIECRRSTLGLFAVALLVLGIAGCASKEAEPAPAAADQADHAMPASGAPRVFFVEPAMGATVTSPVHMVFGTENFTIEPRVEGEVHHGAGHHHIGVDTTCLPPATVIENAAPWVHFGDGSAAIDVQLPPGEHHIVTQVGDGEHRTLDEPGLCAELHIVVVEGEGDAGEDDAPSE